MESKGNPVLEAQPHLNSGLRSLGDISHLNAVLLAVHDAEMRGLLRFGLKQKGFTILEASTGREAIDVARGCQIGAVLLDMDVTDADGLTVIKQLREWSQIPILVLAGRVNRAGPVAVLGRGANDYLRRPIDIEELSGRLRIAQSVALPSSLEVFQSGSLTVDLRYQKVSVGNRTVSLTATEYSLLQLFVRYAGMALTHAQILREVWGSEMLDKVSYLRVYLRALRKKLENPPEPELFLTERAMGYRLVCGSCEARPESRPPSKRTHARIVLWSFADI